MLTTRLFLLVILAGTALTACNGTQTRLDSREFEETVTGSSGGYTYGLVLSEAGTYSAQAFVVGGTDAGAPVTAGTVEYTGVYDVVFGESPATTLTQETGTLILTADFDADTVSGAAGGLVVDGGINLNTLNGGVTFNDNPGSLSGVIGENQVVGTFQGVDGTNFGFAGGFILTPAAGG